VPKISGRHSFPPSMALVRPRAEEYAGFITCEGGGLYRSPNPVFSRSGLFTSHCVKCQYGPLYGVTPFITAGTGSHIANASKGNRFLDCGLSHRVSPHTHVQRSNRSSTPTRAIPLELRGTTGENTCLGRLEMVSGEPSFIMHDRRHRDLEIPKRLVRRQIKVAKGGSGCKTVIQNLYVVCEDRYSI